MVSDIIINTNIGCKRLTLAKVAKIMQRESTLRLGKQM
jgi:hypothetical protein